MNETTITFSLGDKKNDTLKKTLNVIYDALKEKGYNPINQLIGYLLTEDPIYITTYNNARKLMQKIDRDELLKAILISYLNK